MSFTETLLAHLFFVKMSSTKLSGRSKLSTLALVLLLPLATALAQTASPPKKTPPASPAHAAQGVATVADAEAFMKKAEAQLADLSEQGNRAGWVQENFITDDTEIIAPRPKRRSPR
jgi:hypothetical protein